MTIGEARSRSSWIPAFAGMTMGRGRWRASEIPLLLLLLHRRARIVIDHATLTLGRARKRHLADDRGQCVGIRLDRAGQRIAAERAEAHAPYRRLFAVAERHALVVDHHQDAVTLDDGPLGGEVERHDVDALLLDVLPNIELGPVREREHADTLAAILARVVEPPQFRSLVLRIPLVLRATEREDALLRAR